MSEVVLLIDELRSYSEISICRICHEEEFESCKSLEAPCSCSGTAKVFLFYFNLFFTIITYIYILYFVNFI